MECINHKGVQASGTCTLCGAGLCSTCFTRFEPVLCEKCLTKHNNAVERKCRIEIGITLAIFIICFFMYLFAPNRDSDQFILFALLLTGAYWGRSTLSGSSVPAGVVVNMQTYGVMAIFRFCLAIVFGVILMPFAIYKRVREVMKIRETRTLIAQGKI